MEPMKITNFELYDIVLNGDKEEIDSLEELELEGWVKTNRDNGSIGFVEFNDGTYFKSVQLVYTDKSNNHDVLSSLSPLVTMSYNSKLVIFIGSMLNAPCQLLYSFKVTL